MERPYEALLFSTYEGKIKFVASRKKLFMIIFTPCKGSTVLYQKKKCQEKLVGESRRSIHVEW